MKEEAKVFMLNSPMSNIRSLVELLCHSLLPSTCCLLGTLYLAVPQMGQKQNSTLAVTWFCAGIPRTFASLGIHAPGSCPGATFLLRKYFLWSLFFRACGWNTSFVPQSVSLLFPHDWRLHWVFAVLIKSSKDPPSVLVSIFVTKRSFLSLSSLDRWPDCSS